MGSEAIELEIGARTVRVSNPAKVLFPKAKKTKLDMGALGEQIEERKAQLLANNGNGDGTTKSRSLLSLLSLN